jgi:hypothetical protein
MKTTVASVGQDGLVIVWKDCRVQRALRSNLANAALLSSQIAIPNANTNVGLPDLRPEKSADVDGGASLSAEAPAYIVEFAKTLKDEKHLTTDQVVEQLQDQGHSLSIIEAVKRLI